MDKYEKEDIAGQGTYGVVYKAKEKATGRKVALKKLRILKAEEGVGFSAYREIKMLQELKHENIVGLLDVFAHNSNVNLVFEYLEWDLEKVIKDKSIILSDSDIKCYMLQLLRGGMEVFLSQLLGCNRKGGKNQPKLVYSSLIYIAKILELGRNKTNQLDLKPSNLLLGPEGLLKIGDFGLARPFGSPNNVFTCEVVTRWYRAPELLFGAKSYPQQKLILHRAIEETDAIDMWSVGCIFAELMLRTPYFPGDSDIDQLSKIFSALGTPSEEIWPGVTSLPDFVPFNYCAPTPYRNLFTAAGDDAIDLLSKLLKFNPLERPSALEALQHPFFSNNPSPTTFAQLPRPTATKPTAPSTKDLEALLKASPSTVKQELKNMYTNSNENSSSKNMRNIIVINTKDGTSRTKLQLDDADGLKIKRKLDMNAFGGQE